MTYLKTVYWKSLWATEK